MHTEAVCECQETEPYLCKACAQEFALCIYEGTEFPPKFKEKLQRLPEESKKELRRLMKGEAT